MRVYAAAMVFAAWLAFLPIFFVRLPGLFGHTSRRSVASIAGVLIVAVSFAMVWSGATWITPTNAPAPAAGAVIALLSAAFSLWAVTVLGTQWSIQARLRADHELITSGPYQWVRHPVYLAFLGMLIGTGLVFAPSAWHVVLAVPIYLVGTALRVRAEDALLRQRFGAAFDEYVRRTPALLPFPRL